jgi:hypothetical protein
VPGEVFSENTRCVKCKINRRILACMTMLVTDDVVVCRLVFR